MQRKSFQKMVCPIARSLERVGEWWSILIIRDALHGFTRFDQFEKSLNIAPNMLTRRLTALVNAGLLERRRYNERLPRYEYVLTQKGRDLRHRSYCDDSLGEPPLRSRGPKRHARRQENPQNSRSGTGGSKEWKAAL